MKTSEALAVSAFPNIYARYSKRTGRLDININGRQYSRSKNIQDLQKAIDDYNELPSQDKLNKIYNLLNPVGQSSSDIQKFSREFEERAGRLYLKGTDIPLPRELQDRYVTETENGDNTEYLVNFWINCLLNPNAQARDGFIKYINDFGITISPLGYAILYKAVYNHPKRGNILPESKGSVEYKEFIAKEVVKVKSQRKSLKNYNIYESKSDDGTISYRRTTGKIKDGETLIDDLQTAFDKINDIQYSGIDDYQYTDMHTRKMDVRLGTVVWMDREKCDPNIRNDCSYGLHIGSWKYVQSFGRHVSCTILACYVNPKNIVALPQYDHSKIRCCEYLPFGIMEKDKDGNWDQLESGIFELDYIDYETKQITAAFGNNLGDQAIANILDRRRRILNSTYVPKIETPLKQLKAKSDDN